MIRQFSELVYENKAHHRHTHGAPISLIFGKKICFLIFKSQCEVLPVKSESAKNGHKRCNIDHQMPEQNFARQM